PIQLFDFFEQFFLAEIERGRFRLNARFSRTDNRQKSQAPQNAGQGSCFAGGKKITARDTFELMSTIPDEKEQCVQF
ncbi:MAG: hypothetical protein ACRD3W_01125, partial [Terriglobales bacterium]